MKIQGQWGEYDVIINEEKTRIATRLLLDTPANGWGAQVNSLIESMNITFKMIQLGKVEDGSLFVFIKGIEKPLNDEQVKTCVEQLCGAADEMLLPVMQAALWDRFA